MILRFSSAGDFASAFAELLNAAPNPGDAPALWELLARLARDGGADPLAQELFRRLWDDGVVTAATALALAESALDRGAQEDAQQVLVQAFGPDPQDARARTLLARALAADAPDRAWSLLRDTPPNTADEALFAIDTLRSADRLFEAAEVARQARTAFPDDPRIPVRQARLTGARGDWLAALEAWRDIDGASPRDRPEAVLQQARLLLRLERNSEAAEAAARLLAMDGDPTERFLRVAALGTPELTAPAFHRAWAAHLAGQALDWERIGRQLLDMGWVGALGWLSRQGAPLPHPLRVLVHRALKPEMLESLADGGLDAAIGRRSPDLFLDNLGGLLAPGTSAAQKDRILIVNATLAAGGAERQIVALAQALLTQGIAAANLHFAFFSLAQDRGHDHFQPALRVLGVTLHDLRKSSPDVADMAPETLALPVPMRDDAIRLTGLVRRLRPQVLHGWQDRAAVAAGWVGLLEAVPRVVMSARNMQPQRRGPTQGHTGAVLSVCSRRPNMRLTANSAAGARDYESWLDLPQGSVQPLYNGIGGHEAAAARPVRAARRRLTVGGVFRLAANKRPLLWLDTVAHLAEILPDRDVHARLVGTGPFRDEVRAHARHIGFDRLDLAEGLRDPAEIYADMDVLLLMSRIEGLPNVLLEAQAMGLPVAACDVGGSSEAMYQGRDGGRLLLGADTTAKAAAEALRDWIDGVTAAGPQGRQAFVRDRFGLAALGRRTLALYRGQDTDEAAP